MAIPSTPVVTSPPDGATVSGVITVQWEASSFPDVIAPSFIDATSQVYAPTIQAGSAPNTIAPSFIASGATVYQPTVVEGAAGGTTHFRDDFTDTDAVLVQNHTSTWAGGAGTGSLTKHSGTNDGKILNNRAYGADTGAPVYYVTAFAPASADYEIEAVQHRISTLNYIIDYRLRWDRVADTYYRVTYDVTLSDFRFYRVVAGVSSLIATAANDLAWAAGEGKTVVVRVETNVSGNPVLTVWADGVQQLTFEDTSADKITAASDVGVLLGSPATHGFHLDSLVVRDIP